jgi:hypothetical protein
VPHLISLDQPERDPGAKDNQREGGVDLEQKEAYHISKWMLPNNKKSEYFFSCGKLRKETPFLKGQCHEMVVEA